MAAPTRTLRTAISSLPRPTSYLLPSATAGPSRRYKSNKSTSPAPSSPSSSSSSATSWTLPEIKIIQTHPWRYKSHYDSVLAEDLLYMSYDHNGSLPTTPSASSPTEPEQTRAPTPYEANRPLAPPRGNRPLKPSTRPITPYAHSLPLLKSITIHTMIKEAIGNKPALLNAIMALRAISGVTQHSMGNIKNEGVQVVVSKSGAAAFKLRAGMPVAVKITLTGETMYTFLSTLLEFVLPRLREFPGLPIPPSSANTASPSSLSGVVAFGLPSEAMALFPQIEGNLDSYSRMHGFHVAVETGRRGKGAQDEGRALLSGFRMPFTRG